MNTTTPTNVIETIRKLMNLADISRGATPQEAETAFQKARALMIKHGIESIEAGPTDDPEIGAAVADEIRFERSRYGCDRHISQIFQVCFGVKVVHSAYWNEAKRRQNYMMHLFGDPEDVAIAKEFYEILRKIFYHGLYQYVRVNGLKHTAEIEKSYFIGVKRGLLQANETAKAYIYKQQTKANADRYAIVLASKERRAEALMNRTFPKLRNLRKQTFHQGHAYEAGLRRGASAELARKVQ